MTTSVVTDMNLSQNTSKQSINGGRVGGRRKTKGNHFTQKKNKLPRRGMGVAQLEQLRLQPEALENHQIQSFNPSLGFTTSNCTVLPNVAVQYFRPPHASAPTPAMSSFQTIGIHGGSVYCTDHVVDPAIIGLSNGGFRFGNPREVSSVASYVKCGSDCCGVCHKKKRMVNPYRNFGGSNKEMMDAGKARRSSGQVTEVMSVGRSGGGSMTEFEFFPGKGGGAEEYKEMMRMGSPMTWCGSGASVAGGIGLRGGDGSCVTVMTGGEEGSVSSVDLSLKLSY